MSQRLIKVFTLLLCVLFLLSAVGCGKSSSTADKTDSSATTKPDSSSTPSTPSTTDKKENDTPKKVVGEGPIVDEKITLHAFAVVLDNQTCDFPTLWFYDELEKETNIHIDWEMVKQADWSTRLNLMFSSGDYADVILRGDVDIEEYGVSQGIIVPLDEYIPDNMPNYYSRLYMNDADKALYASDGKMYFIGNLIAQSVNHTGNDYINKAWLDKLGLEIPKTVDELTEVLIAFRDNDPNGNGEKDELAMSGGDLVNETQGVYTHFAKFGVPLNYRRYLTVDENNKVQFHGFYPGFRAACEWLNKLYKEGLMDMESITQDSNVWATKVNADRVGYTTYLRTLNTAWKPEIAQNYVSIIPPASEYGDQVPRLLELPTFGAAVTIANKYIPETLQWIDRQLETERMMVSYNGPLHPGGPMEPTMEISPEGKYRVLHVPENNLLYSIVPVWHAQFFAPADYYTDIYEMAPHRLERYQTSVQYEEAGVLEPQSYYILMSLVKPDNETSIELTRMYNDIDKFMRETISDFITNGVTDDKWQNYLKTLENLDIQRYIDLYQAAYDDYLAKTSK